MIDSSSTAEPNGHPVAKPLDWMLWSVRLASRAGDTILDPFMGSGTTGVAAIRLGRNFIGIEKDANYCQIARERLTAEQEGSTLAARKQGQLALFGRSA